MEDRPPNRKTAGRARSLCLQGMGCGLAPALIGALLLVGCSSKYYRKSADKEAYRIIEQVEGRVFGRTNAFTVETRYSGRKPKEILPQELIDSRLQTNRRVLTVSEALRLAASQSRRYQTEKERLYLSALTLTGSRYAFSPHFFANATAALTRQSNRDVIGSVQPQVGVNQLLRSGGRLGVSVANDLLRYYTGDPQRSVISTLSVNLAQPLLRGFGRNSSQMEALTQAERNVVYAVRDYAFFQDEFALEIVNDYFALLEQKDFIRNRYTNYLGRVQLRKRLESRKDRELLSGVDQARQTELSSRNNYVNSLASYRNALDQFKIKLGLTLDEQVLLDDAPLQEVRQAGLLPAPLNVEHAYRFAVRKQVTLLNAIDQFEDSKRKVRVKADALRPGLNLFGDASLKSEEPTDYTHFDPDQIRANGGVELELPLDRLAERNDYRAALVTFEAQLRTLTLALDTLRDGIQRGLRTLEQRRQNYEIQQKALELANRRVASNTLLQQAGRADVRDIVESQDAQINAQNAVTTALLDYQEARLQLMLDVGALQTGGERFWLKDHLTEALRQEQQAQAVEIGADQPIVPPEQFFNN